MKKQRQWRMKAAKIPGAEGFWVTNDGRVFSCLKGPLIELIPSLAHNGYLRVQIVRNGVRRWFPAHRLVLIAWGPSECVDKTVNHKNGIKTDNRIENLEWMTQLENRRHAIEVLGKSSAGVKNPSAKLNEEAVKDIRTSTLTPLELSNKYNVTRECIYNVYNRITWKSLD